MHEYSLLEMARSLKVAQSFSIKFHKDLEVTDKDVTAVTKRKMPTKGTNFITTPKLVRKMQKIIDRNPRMSINVIVKELNVS